MGRFAFILFCLLSASLTATASVRLDTAKFAALPEFPVETPNTGFFHNGVIGANNYLYCHNNPANFIDPLGLEKKKDDDDLSAASARKQLAEENENAKATQKYYKNVAKGTEALAEATAGLVDDPAQAVYGKSWTDKVLGAVGVVGGVFGKVKDVVKVGEAVNDLRKIAKGEEIVGEIAKDAKKVEKTTEKTVEAVKNDQKLFRGVPSNGTEKAKLAEQGVAKPRGTALDQNSLTKHVLGEDVNAGVTSWTPDRNVAKRFSGSDGTILEVAANAISNKVVPRPSIKKYSDEKEVLLEGIIQGTQTPP